MRALEQRPNRLPQDKIRPEQLGRLFLRLGTIGFGGPLAHIALMQHECVEKRGWINKQDFLQGLTLCQMLPGPTSTQLAIYSGYRIAGLAGGVVAGCAFILPAFFLLLFLTWSYFRFGAVPAVQGIFYGMSPVVLAMILASSFRLAKSAAVDKLLAGILAASALLVAFFSFNVILLFALAAILGIVFYGPRRKNKSAMMHLAIVPLPVLAHLGWFFLKVGSLIFGGGLVIVPFIEREVVNSLGWLTHREFLDGLALGQITPGPVVITATFVGYKVASFPGALIATIAIFLPSFIFVFVGAGFLRKIEDSLYVKALLKTLNVTAVGAVIGALWPLSRTSLGHAVPLALFGGSLIALLRYKLNFLNVLACGAVLGWLAYEIGL